jgi:hypothetical protein
MGEMDYHFYTGGWSLGRFATHVYDFFHSDWCFPYGPNYVTGWNATDQGIVWYPELDDLVYNVQYCGSYSEAISNCKKAMGLHSELCVNIPLWSSQSYWAARSDTIQGIVNMEGYGPENGYSFANVYKTDGRPIRYAIKSQPTALNVLYSSWYYDRQVLDRISLYGGVDVPPYNIAYDQAGYLQDWEVGIWTDPDDGENKSKATFWFRKDSWFAEPSTGNQEENVNATVWAISTCIQQALDDAWLYSAVDDIHHFNIVSSHCVEVYYGSLSYWNTYEGGGAYLPPRVWLQPPLATYVTESFTLDPPSTVPLTSEIAWIDYVTHDGTPLTMFTDYNIYWSGIGGSGSPSTLKINTDLASGNITVGYWAVGDATGYWPGDLPWQTVAEGAGSWYLTAVSPGAGGSATLKRNPYFYFETPPEHSEIDFKWVWGARDGSRPAPDQPAGPRTGYYIVDDRDLDLAKEASGTQGVGIPDPLWFPGADLAPAGGYINVFDVASVTGNLGTKHSETP